MKTIDELIGIDRDEFTGTGKDFPFKHISDLKQSAIDDIKELLTFKEIEKWERREAVIQYIKRKFNIEEKELK